MRQPARPLTTGFPVPPAPSDIAQMLEVVWRVENGIKRAASETWAIEIKPHETEATRSIFFVYVGRACIAGGSIGYPEPGEAEREAVLALAEHLAAGFDTIGSAAGAGAVEAGEDRAVKSLEHREPEPVRAFKVGDRIRVIKDDVHGTFLKRTDVRTIKEVETDGALIVGAKSDADGSIFVLRERHVELVSEPAPLPAPPSASGWSPKKGDVVRYANKDSVYFGKVFTVGYIEERSPPLCPWVESDDRLWGVYAQPGMLEPLPAPSLTGGAEPEWRLRTDWHNGSCEIADVDGFQLVVFCDSWGIKQGGRYLDALWAEGTARNMAEAKAAAVAAFRAHR